MAQYELPAIHPRVLLEQKEFFIVGAGPIGDAVKKYTKTSKKGNRYTQSDLFVTPVENIVNELENKTYSKGTTYALKYLFEDRFAHLVNTVGGDSHTWVGKRVSISSYKESYNNKDNKPQIIFKLNVIEVKTNGHIESIPKEKIKK